MGSPPKQVQLDLSMFPEEPWARALVAAVNQLSVQVTQVATVAAPVYKTVSFKTKAAVADSFPIDIPSDIRRPINVQVAQVLSGTPESAPAVVWVFAADPLKGTGVIRLVFIYGLAPSTDYSISLAVL